MLKIIILSFDFSGYEVFDKLNNALIYSIEKHEPRAKWISTRIPEPQLHGRLRGFVANTIKLNYWNKELQQSSDGDHIVFLDADTLLVNPINDVFNNNFDVAYTLRTRSKWILNAGVLFVKVNERSRAFFRRFTEINNMMFKDQSFHDLYKVKYAGMNQAAFGYMLEKEPYHATLLPLPCGIWNACGEDWLSINDKTRIIHINGQARKAIFGGKPEGETIKPYNIWNQYYREWRDDERLTQELGDQHIDIEKMAEV